ncbi:serine hydrolase domain-containing protein [Nonomuraea typhae]|uniref:serine hydrolase domain-containing protein n=1 Tax=Nonomuraea typhae TaxID=2603600 RepID=UPI0012FA218F|nr:serine hydrolase domain-containing protein [Nonomuraea typhae]
MTVASRRAVLGLIGTSAFAAPEPGGLRRLERFIADRAGQDLFSGTVLVAHRGRPVLQRSYGMADKEKSLPNGRDTVFDLASITKCCTGVAIAQLAQQGKLAFHEKLGAYLDGFPTGIGDTVTVHQLLTHTSGVGRPPIGSGPPDGPWDTIESFWDGTAQLIRGLPRRFVPGTRYAYSNDGYFVLGEIVAAVSGQSYYDYVRRSIFAPAGMTRAHFPTRPQMRADPAIARPYATRPSGGRADVSDSPYFPFVGSPARGAYCTAADLLAFQRALRDGTLLDPAYAGLITGGKMVLPPEERPDVTRQSMFYGYGFLSTIVDGRTVTGHSGSGPGAANNLDLFADRVAVILGNYDTTVTPIVEQARRLL